MHVAAKRISCFVVGMDKTPTTFAELIEAWGIAAFASDMHISYSTASAMKQRDSVAPKYWEKIIKNAPRHGLRVSAVGLIAMRSKVAA